MNKALFFVLGILFPCMVWADVSFTSGKKVKVNLPVEEAEVVHTAFDIFKKDFQRVFGAEVVEAKKAHVIIGTIGLGSEAEKKLSSQPFL